MPRVGAPAELGGLQSRGNEATHRPGVDELAALAPVLGGLRVTFGDMDGLDVEVARQARPVLVPAGLMDIDLVVLGHGCQGTLKEGRGETGIGAHGDYGRGCAGLVDGKDFLAQAVVRALRCAQLIFVRVWPRLDAGIEVEGAVFPAQLN